MDVDTPSGTNSGAGKKRFEVKKVRLVGVARSTRPVPAGEGRSGTARWLRADPGREPPAAPLTEPGVRFRTGAAKWGGGLAEFIGVCPGQWVRRVSARGTEIGQSEGAAARARGWGGAGRG